MASGICSKCNNSRRIVNKKYSLCGVCNFERLHPGVSYGVYKGGGVKKWKEANKEKKIAAMKQALVVKNPLNRVTKQKYCASPGCMKEVVKTKYCTGCARIHNRVQRKKNVKITTLHEQAIKRDLSKLKKEAKEKFYEENANRCEGCQRSFLSLQYSHIISVGQRKDLELLPENHNMLCQTCHEDWESYNAERLLQLEVLYPNLEFIRKWDTEKFWKLYYVFNDAMMFDVCKKIEEIDENYKEE